MPEVSERNIALTGFMAVGKSVVGQRLARRLKRRFVDLDRTIENREGMKVREIFERKGEDYFRKLEKRVLQDVLRLDGQVIATGGGAIEDEDNLRLLKERSLLVCLTAPVNILLRRAGGGKERPLLSGTDPQKRIAELLARRGPAYAQADASVDTTFLTVDEVVEEIVRLAEARRAGTPEISRKAER